MLGPVLALALVLTGQAPAGAGENAPADDPAPDGATSSPAAEPAPVGSTVTPAAEPAPTALAASAPASGHIGTDVVLTATLTQPTEPDPTPVEGGQVVVERWNPAEQTWGRVGTYLTDAAGRVRHTLTVRAGTNRFRAVFAEDAERGLAGSTSPAVDVRALKVATTLTVGGKGTVVDERRVAVNLRWRATDGRRVTGRVTLYSKRAGTSTWTRAARPVVRDGFVSVLVRPRHDTVWRAVGPAGTWHQGDSSGWHRIDNVPPISPVVLPAGAPKPDIRLAPQARGVGTGLNASVTRIPDSVWRSMVGRSWHRGCPVGRSGLRLIRMNYWGYDGYRHRGELVVRTSVAGDTVRVFRSLYEGRYPMRYMYRVDRFGWSRKLQGANDYKSMASGNTSAFNCRQVVGRPGVMSPHTYGDAIDINPWENPYVSQQGTYPNTWWLSRSHKRVAWRSWSHPVVQAFSRQGFVWGGSYRDFHHFES